MTQFIITAPDGKKYKVNGPPGSTKEDALRQVQQKLGASPPEEKIPAPPSVNLREARAGVNREEFDNLSTWKKPLVAADDILTLAGEGMTFGFGPKLAATVRSKLKGTSYDDERATMDRRLDDARDRSGLVGTVAEIGGMVAPVGMAAKAGATFTKIPKVGKYLGLPADAAAVGAIDAYGHDRDVAKGAAIGGAFGVGGQLVGKGVSKLISPFKTSPERVAAANVLKREGVDITGGQKVGSESLRRSEAQMGGNAAQDFSERQLEQFTSAALKRVGTTAKRATPDVLDKSFSRIGQGFDTLATRNAIVPSPNLGADLTQVAVDYGGLIAPSSRAPIVKNTIDDLINLAQSGRIDGSVYKSMRSLLTRKVRTTKEPELKDALNGIVEALDDAMETTIARNNPNDLGAWTKVRRQYRNIIVLEQAMKTAGEKSALGLISPSSLRNATVSKQGTRNYVRGKGDYTDLARSGEALIKPMSSSGTAENIKANAMSVLAPHFLGAGIGGAYGGSEGGTPGAVAGAIAGLTLPSAVGKAMLSKAGRAYLGNQFSSKIPPKVKEELLRLGVLSGVLGYQ